MADENELNEVVGDVPAIDAETPVEPPPAEETPVDEPPDPASLQAEIDALEERRKKAEEDARYWRRQKAEARKDYFTQPETPPAGKPQAEPSDLKRPDPDSYDDYNQYVEALTDYKVEVKRREWDREEHQKTQSATQQQRQAKLQDGINRGYEKYDDFEDVALDPSVPITPMVTDILADSEMPADVAYYLGKNRPEAVKISRMTPTAAAREIAKIEMKLTATPADPKPTKKTTSAPPPINPVGSNAPASGKDPEHMSQAEFNAWREKQGARRF